MSRFVLSAIAVLIICSTAMAQQAVTNTQQTETTRTAKKAMRKKKHHRENGVADAQRQAGQVTVQPAAVKAGPARVSQAPAAAY
jgi:hypothetical protein